MALTVCYRAKLCLALQYAEQCAPAPQFGRCRGCWIKVLEAACSRREIVKIKAVIYEAAEGGYWAKVPSLPGLYTQGETLEELEANLREAVELYLSDDISLEADALQENGRVLEIAL